MKKYIITEEQLEDIFYIKGIRTSPVFPTLEAVKLMLEDVKSPNSKRFELEQRKVKALEEISITQALDFICSATDLEQAEARRQMLKDAGVAE